MPKISKIQQRLLISYELTDRIPAPDEENKAISKADERQDVVLPVLGAPFLAATLPLAAAGAIGVYGAYGDAILALLNSLLGKKMILYCYLRTPNYTSDSS